MRPTMERADLDVEHGDRPTSTDEQPEESPAAAIRRRFSVREAMVATAAIAFLLAAYRIEVNHARGLGLVPACAALIAVSWYRDAVAARLAAGRPPGVWQKVDLAGGGLLVGLAIVGAAGLVFAIVAEATRSASHLNDVIGFFQHRPGSDVGSAAIGFLFSGGFSAASALAVGKGVRRALWPLATPLAAAPPGERALGIHGRIRSLMITAVLVAVLLATFRSADLRWVGLTLLPAACFGLIADVWYVEARKRAEARGEADQAGVVLTALKAIGVAAAMLGLPALAFGFLFFMMGGFHIPTQATSLDRLLDRLSAAAVALIGGALPAAQILRRRFWPADRDPRASQP